MLGPASRLWRRYGAWRSRPPPATVRRKALAKRETSHQRAHRASVRLCRRTRSRPPWCVVDRRGRVAQGRWGACAAAAASLEQARPATPVCSHESTGPARARAPAPAPQGLLSLLRKLRKTGGEVRSRPRRRRERSRGRHAAARARASAAAAPAASRRSAGGRRPNAGSMRAASHVLQLCILVLGSALPLCALPPHPLPHHRSPPPLHRRRPASWCWAWTTRARPPS